MHKTVLKNTMFLTALVDKNMVRNLDSNVNYPIFRSKGNNFKKSKHLHWVFSGKYPQF